MNNKQKILVNVASSHYCVEGFINYDNHIFLNFIRYPLLFKILFSKKYHELFDKFLYASRNFKLHKLDCKKELPHLDGSIDHILCSNFLEHVYQEEAVQIVNGFYRKLKTGGTLHIMLPNLELYLRKYQEIIATDRPEIAADWLNFETLLTSKKRPTFKFQLLEFLGSYGLKHLRMYDRASADFLMTKAGFSSLSKPELCASFHYGLNNGDLHLYYMKE